MGFPCPHLLAAVILQRTSARRVVAVIAFGKHLLLVYLISGLKQGRIERAKPLKV